jgi:hypothetical protein
MRREREERREKKRMSCPELKSAIWENQFADRDDQEAVRKY